MACYTMIIVLVISLASLAMAQYDTCTRYGVNIDVLGASYADIYNKILSATVDLATTFSKLIIVFFLPTVTWN